MNNLSKKEKFFLEKLIDAKNGEHLSVRVKEVFFSYLKTINKQLELEISSDEIFLKDMKNGDIDILFTLFNELLILKKQDYIFIYDDAKEKCSNLTIPIEECHLEVKYNCGNDILEILNSNYCISEKLREFMKNKYKTEKKIENEKNFYIAITTILISSLINVIIYLQQIYNNILKIYEKCILYPNVINFMFSLFVFFVLTYEKKNKN